MGGLLCGREGGANTSTPTSLVFLVLFLSQGLGGDLEVLIIDYLKNVNDWLGFVTPHYRCQQHYDNNNKTNPTTDLC